MASCTACSASSKLCALLQRCSSFKPCWLHAAATSESQAEQACSTCSKRYSMAMRADTADPSKASSEGLDRIDAVKQHVHHLLRYTGLK
jgi:hypothetical protein